MKRYTTSDPKPCLIRFDTDEPGCKPSFIDISQEVGRLECWILNYIRDGRTITLTDATDPSEIAAWEKRTTR